MKIKVKRKLLMWLVLLISSSGVCASEPGLFISEWNGNKNFSFSEENEFLHVAMDKHPFESFSVKLQNIEALKGSICNLKLRTSEDCFLKVDISNGEEIGHSDSQNFIHIKGSNEFSVIDLDFTSFLEKYKNPEGLYLIVYVEPGKVFKGSMDFQSVSFIASQSTSKENSLHIYPSPATEFTIVEVPDGRFSKLRLIDAKGRIVKTVNYDFTKISEYRFETSEFAAGVYTLTLEGKSESLRANLVIR